MICSDFSIQNLVKVLTGDGHQLKLHLPLGQIASDVVTDLLIRMSDKQKEDKQTSDQRIAYVQIMANVYRIGLSLDVANIGKVITPQYDGKGKDAKFNGWETTVAIEQEKKIERTVAVLEAIGGISDFANRLGTLHRSPRTFS